MELKVVVVGIDGGESVVEITIGNVIEGATNIEGKWGLL